MLYTLVIISTLYGYDYRSAGSVNTAVVPGFSTEQACINAANKVKLVKPVDKNNQGIVVDTVCVSKDV